MSLESIASLRDDWDGNGSSAPSAEVLRTAAWVASLYPSTTCIVASPCGSIILEWRLLGSYLEAEVAEGGLVEWMFEVSPGRYLHWKTKATPGAPP